MAFLLVQGDLVAPVLRGRLLGGWPSRGAFSAAGGVRAPTFAPGEKPARAPSTVGFNSWVFIFAWGLWKKIFHDVGVVPA